MVNDAYGSYAASLSLAFRYSPGIVINDSLVDRVGYWGFTSMCRYCSDYRCCYASFRTTANKRMRLRCLTKRTFCKSNNTRLIVCEIVINCDRLYRMNEMFFSLTLILTRYSLSFSLDCLATFPTTFTYGSTPPPPYLRKLSIHQLLRQILKDKMLELHTNPSIDRCTLKNQKLSHGFTRVKFTTLFQTPNKSTEKLTNRLAK